MMLFKDKKFMFIRIFISQYYYRGAITRDPARLC